MIKNSLFKIFVLFLGVFLSTAAVAAQDYTVLYQALNTAGGIDAQLAKVKALPAGTRNAYEGALLMRKAGLVAVPAKKLELFKKGNRQLEAAIEAEPANADFRLLRLIIQENAPKILGYNKNIAADSKFVLQNFKNLSAAGQAAAREYSRRSAALRL